MDQNQGVDNDLQKAIDDITNNTNIDPVFSDPVAAPSSIPEGDTGELDEPVGPFATPEVAPVPEPPVSGFVPEPESTPPSFEDFGTPAFEAPSAPAVDSTPMAGQMPMPPSKTPQHSVMPDYPEIPVPPSPARAEAQVKQEPESQFQAAAMVETSNTSVSPSGSSMRRVKTAALRDLIPLIDRLNLSPSQRFNICRSIFEDLRDYSVLDQAYRAAVEIRDDTERAEALLYLVESIDKM